MVLADTIPLAAGAGFLQVGALRISPWVYGPAAFVVWVVLLGLIQHFVLRRMRRSSNPLVAGLGRALALPAVLAILVIGLILLQQLLPLPASVDKPAGIVTKVLLGLLGVVLGDRLLILLLDRIADRTGSVELKQGIIKALAHIVVYAIGLLVVLGSLGVSITPLVASLGVASLAVALALQKPLANMFAGLFILADRSLNTGDFIALETGEKGYIEKIGLRHTRIRMLANEIVIVPNEQLLSSTIHNKYLPDQPISLLIQVGVHYDSDLRHVEQVTIDVARKVQQTVEGAVPDWQPFIRYHTFDASSINFTVILRVKEYVANYLVKHEFVKALHARYRQEGIIIPFPLRTLDIPDKTARQLATAFRQDAARPTDRDSSKTTQERNR